MSNKFYLAAGLQTNRDGTYSSGNRFYIAAGLIPEVIAGGSSINFISDISSTLSTDDIGLVITRELTSNILKK